MKTKERISGEQYANGKIEKAVMNIQNLILENRKNPHLNLKYTPYDILYKYHRDQDIFISFTEYNKLGIFPKTIYDPVGIYTYPLSTVWKKFNHNLKEIIVPFPRKELRNFLWIIKPKGYYVSLSRCTENDIRKLYFNLRKDFPYIEPLEYILQRRNISNGQKYWNLIYDTIKNKFSNYPIIINKKMREYGICGISDDDDSSIIHSAEPSQAVFFSRECLNIVDHIDMQIDNQRDLYDRESRIRRKIFYGGDNADFKNEELPYKNNMFLSVNDLDNLASSPNATRIFINELKKDFVKTKKIMESGIFRLFNSSKSPSLSAILVALSIDMKMEGSYMANSVLSNINPNMFQPSSSVEIESYKKELPLNLHYILSNASLISQSKSNNAGILLRKHIDNMKTPDFSIILVIDVMNMIYKVNSAIIIFYFYKLRTLRINKIDVDQLLNKFGIANKYSNYVSHAYSKYFGLLNENNKENNMNIIEAIQNLIQESETLY